jgi:HEAT repeat protein
MAERIDQLLNDLRSGDGVTRKRARETLVLIGDPAVAPLRVLLGHPDKQMRWEAAKALSAMIDPGSLDDLLQALGDQRSELRWLAAGGLIGLGPRSAAPVLRSLIQPSPSRGRLEMSHRIHKELSQHNDLLAELVGPVTDVLRGSDPTPVAPRAARALNDLETLTEV